jgi:hypothetical protein
VEFNPFKFFFQAIFLFFGSIFFFTAALFEWVGGLLRKESPPISYEATNLKLQDTAKLTEEVSLLNKAAEFPDEKTFG